MRRKWRQFWCNHKWVEFFGVDYLPLRLCEHCSKCQYHAFQPEFGRHFWRKYL